MNLMANYCAFVRMVVIAIFLVATLFTKNALAIDSCSVVSGCPTGDAALGVNFTGLQPEDLNKGSFTITAEGADGFSCSFGSGTADNSSSCTAHYNSGALNIECLIEHLDCRNNPFDFSVSAPAGYSCSASPGSKSLANCSDNSPITVNCTTPVCIPDGSCNAPTPACGQTTPGIDNCDNPCSKTGPACLVDGSECTAISVNNGNAVTSGQTYPATVSMKNPAGNFTTWTTNAGYKLGSSNPRDNTVWGLSRVALPSTTTPGNTATFNFNVTAPTVTSQSTESFYWEMLREGVHWFGAQCQYNVTVNPAITPTVAVSCSASPATTTTGTNVTWTTRVLSGGTSPFTYTWSGSDSLNGRTASSANRDNDQIVSYSTAGVKTGSVRVTDSLGTQSPQTNCSNSVTIPAPFDFNLTNGGNKTVARGSSVNNSTIATLSSGATQSVTFSASGFPSGVTHSFSPTSCNPACSSTLNMAASQTATTGSPTITVTGTAGSLTKTTTFTLTVTAPPATCGNGTCGGGETCSTCSADCGICPAPPPPPPAGPPPPVGPPPPPASSTNCPWFQTVGGDVHSNTGINTPCGP